MKFQKICQRMEYFYQNSFFFKTGLRPVTLLKKRPWRRCFSVNFMKCLKTSFLTEHLWATASELCLVVFLVKFSGNFRTAVSQSISLHKFNSVSFYMKKHKQLFTGVLLNSCSKNFLVFARKYPQSFLLNSLLSLFHNVFHFEFSDLFSTISILIVALCIMGTLTESLKGCCVRKEPYKFFLEAISDLSDPIDGMPNNQSQAIDEKNSEDISMHGVTVSEKGWCFSIKNFVPSLLFYLFPDLFMWRMSGKIFVQDASLNELKIKNCY